MTENVNWRRGMFRAWIQARADMRAMLAASLLALTPIITHADSQSPKEDCEQTGIGTWVVPPHPPINALPTYGVCLYVEDMISIIIDADVCHITVPQTYMDQAIKLARARWGVEAFA